MASSNSLSICYTQMVYSSAQQSHVELEMGAAENQDRDTDTASLHLVLIPCLTLLSGASFCDLVEAQLAHRGYFVQTQLL